MPRCPECYTEIKTGQECGEIQLKEKDGEYGFPRHGEKAELSSRHFSQCEVQGCKQKARFQMTGCVHNLCGYCLKEMDVLVNFQKHEPQRVYACPVCVSRGGSCYFSSIRWVEKCDVYKVLSEKNICICCFQIKTFDVSGCKHGICCICLKKILNDADVHEHICIVEDCQQKYDLSKIQEMFENSISEMSRRIFAYPGTFCSNTRCEDMPMLRLGKCRHNLCWKCITKGMFPVEDNEIECQMLMRCPVQSCRISFPLDCLKYHVHRLMSSMHLATVFVEPKTLSVCCRCPTFKYELSINLRVCNHTICLSCFEKYILEVENRRQSTYLDLPMEMTKCFQSSCDKEVPTACLKATHMAIKGDPIGVAMYLQVPKGKGNCSSCDLEEIYIELASCKHSACKSCTMKIYKDSNEYGLATCKVWPCGTHIPALCLKAVLDDQGILKDNTDYFNELTKKDENTMKVQKIPDDSSDIFRLTAIEGRCDTECMEKERAIHLLCPSYGKRLSCSNCSTMAVIKFSQCPHGWCLRCLKFMIRIQTDDKLQCKNCASCGSLGNAKRFIKNCENDGLLVPSYLKPIIGSTCCNICKKREAMLEEIDCGHRFCDSCLNLCITLQMTSLKCPVLGCESVESYQANEAKDRKKSVNLKVKCTCCSKKEAVKLMKKCRHVLCQDCSQRILPCPVKGCKSFIDDASSDFLSRHLKSDKDALFICKQMKTRDVCCVCTGDQKGSNSEQVVQIRRCSHIICNSCFTKLQERCKATGISTCPSKGCLELFFISITSSSNDLKMHENYIRSKVSKENHTSVDIIYEREATSKSVIKDGGKVKSYSFQSLKVDEHRVKQNGLPNLGLTCYKNSVFQVLAETPSFFAKLKDITTQGKENWTFTLCEILWRVLSESSSKNDIEDWLLRFQAEFASIDNSFMEYVQHDSLSFLTSILSGIAEEVQKKKKNGSERMSDPTDIFRGEMHDQYTCCKCKKDPKIGECLYRFLATETLRDVFPCSFCNHDTVQKEIQIKKYPDVLVLQLGMISEATDHFERVHRTPKFWENFTGLSNNIHLGKIKKAELSKYKLYGVIVHAGGLTGGHYYAYVKNMQSGEWECRDDSYVRKVSLWKALHSGAYILFYHKIKNSSLV